MTGRTHDTAALTLLGVVAIVDPPQSLTLATVLVAFLANQIGGIAPDIDQPTAPLWRNLPVTGLLGRTVGRLLGGHRFLTHSLLGLWLLGWLVNWLLMFLSPIMPHVDTGVVWWAFMIGAFSHLIMDTFTKEGVPWLLPLPFKLGLPPIRSLRITTGKAVENFVVFPVLLVINIVLGATYYPQIAAFVQTHIKP